MRPHQHAFKVFRTWTIIDWCVYDPSKSPTIGRYQHTQIIKVEDNQAPDFVCPPDMVVAATSGCSSAQVVLPALVATDCSPNVTIVNDSRYAASPGANISGVYPVGTTVVTYKISDGCGNVATCKVRITVEDQKAPGVVCYHGLSTSIAQMPGGIMAMVNAKAFDAGSTDNCTDTTNLRFTIRRASLNPTLPPTATQLTLIARTWACRELKFGPPTSRETALTALLLSSLRITGSCVLRTLVWVWSRASSRRREAIQWKTSVFP
ncbi:MAG: HYR domain-containing protein [Haliscomenobacter sp.]|nr:HYR domain-containing protein [Haliscomenobacter sp.]